MSSGKTAVVIALTLFAGPLLLAPRPGAQVASRQQDLHERLEAARAEIQRVQSRAESVEDQIASVDDQTRAVEEALTVSRELVTQTQAEIGLLRTQIRSKQRLYGHVRERAVDIAVSLYKAGPVGTLEPLLGAKSLDEFSTALEYSSAMTEDQLRVMVSAKRLELELEAETAELEVKLAEALEVRNEQESQAQHLRELRAARSVELAELRRRIDSTRREADGIAAESAEVAARLEDLASSAPAPAPAAPSVVGSSGFAWPLRGAITSGYGPRWGRLHSGIDIDGVTGQPIAASRAGRVVTASYDASGYGYYVVIDHGGGFASLYAHASELYVSLGDSVQQGAAIAAVGSTGASTGDHLHFEIRVSGTPQDPLAYLP